MTIPDSTPMKRCSKCGQEKPATTEYFYKGKGLDGFHVWCKTCQHKRDRERYEADKEAILARNHEWREGHREYTRQHDKERWLTRRNKRLAWGREHHLKNKQRINEQHRQYFRINRDKATVRGQRRKARLLELPNTLTALGWQRCLNYFGGCCAVCGRPPGLWHTIAADHWIPLSKGGGTTPENIVPLCHGIDGCNNSKHNKMPADWLIETFGMRRADKILARIEQYFEWARNQK